MAFGHLSYMDTPLIGYLLFIPPSQLKVSIEFTDFDTEEGQELLARYEESKNEE